MKSLIWKEWRETRWIAIGFLLICLVTSICWKTTFPGHEQGWHAAIWTLLAVVLGARAFAGEKQTTTMEFLAAQPLRKTHLWALKAAWGFGVVLIVVAVSCLFDYLLMRADPFYTAWHLLAAPLSWAFLTLVAVYAVALLSSTLCDKTVVAIGLSFVIWAVVCCIVALIDRFNPFFYQFFNTRWGFPLAALWFCLVFLAGSFLIVAWRDVWPNYPTAVKRGAIGVGVGTLIVLLILSSANIPPDRITRITELEVVRRVMVLFSGEADGRQFGLWAVNTDGDDLLKYPNPPLREREHPAISSRNIVHLDDDLYVARIASGEYAGGCLVVLIDQPGFGFGRPRRERTRVFSENGTVSWIHDWSRWLFFEEKRADGQALLWAVDRVTLNKTRHEDLGDLVAFSDDDAQFIFKKPPESGKQGKVRLVVLRWSTPHEIRLDAEFDQEMATGLSFVTEDIVQYQHTGAIYLTRAQLLGEPRREARVGPDDVPWEVRLHFKVPQSVVERGVEYLSRVAENLWENPLRNTIGRDEPEAIIARLSGDLRERLPESFVQKLMRNAEALVILKDVAAEWGIVLPEELFDQAIFLVPRGRQIIYLKKEDEQRSSLWLLDIESGQSTRILDDIDVTAPAVPKALIAPIMDDHFVFVRDAKTIWTYRDGILKQIFPPGG